MSNPVMVITSLQGEGTGDDSVEGGKEQEGERERERMLEQSSSPLSPVSQASYSF